MIRIILFLLTNLAVMLVFGIILVLSGIHKQSIPGLIVVAGFFGFSGSLISLLMSKWIALHSVGGRIIKNPITEVEYWLLNTTKQCAKRVGIKTPEIAIYQAYDINAFATGSCRDSSLIAVSSALLKNMDQYEAEAVIAHEIAHIVNGDMVTMALLQGIMNTFVIFISCVVSHTVSLLLSNNNNNNNKTNQKNPMIYFAVSMALEMIFGILANIIIMWFSRYREFRADAGSACLVGKEKMIAALQCLKTSYEPQKTDSINVFYINGWCRRSSNFSFNDLFLSHPPFDKRIKALHLGTYSNLL